MHKIYIDYKRDSKEYLKEALTKMDDMFDGCPTSKPKWYVIRKIVRMMSFWTKN